MDIKQSFRHFQKNYICESEAFDKETFTDVDLEGTTKTGLDWYNEYDELGGSKTPEDIVVNDLDILSKNDWYHADNSGQIFDNDGHEVEDWTPELEAFTYDEMVAELGTPEEAVKADEQPGLSDDDYIDPETTLETDDGYDTDFNESCCCGGKKKSKKGKKDKKSKFVPFWAKKKDKDLKEALKTLKNAGYSVINECGVDCELEDDATGFGIAFDDSDYYTEEGECEVCAICGKESCDGEYDEDGNFVCSDCAENSLEQPMEEIDPMDIYFRAGRADNIRDMNRFVR